MNTQEIVEHIKRFAESDPNVDVLWLYGSRAKGTEQPNSDFDLAVAFHSFPNDGWELRLQPELLAQSWSDQLGLADGIISVVDINHIPIQLAMGIVLEGKAITVKDTLRLIREEHRITSMWELDHLYHRRYYG